MNAALSQTNVIYMPASPRATQPNRLEGLRDTYITRPAGALSGKPQ